MLRSIVAIVANFFVSAAFANFARTPVMGA